MGDICDTLNNKNKLKKKISTYRSSRVRQAGLQNLSLQLGFESRVMSYGGLDVARRAFRAFLPHFECLLKGVLRQLRPKEALCFQKSLQEKHCSRSRM